MSTKGKLIVFEELDGSGKETQSNMLVDFLKATGIPHRKVEFPNYDSPSSSLIKMYLSGEFGSSAYDVNEYTASLFYAVDRIASYLKDWREYYENGGLIIADRYFTSNFIHQGSKIVSNMITPFNQRKLEAFIRWVEDIECNKMGLPRPDQVIYLKIHPELSIQNVMNRYNGDSKKMDIHEKDIDYLKKTHDVADYCCECLHWDIVPCSIDGTNGHPHMRSKEEIHDQVVEVLEQLLNS